MLDFVFAFGLGIVFQYSAIAPTRDLPFAKGVVEALKADTLSLAPWQAAMYGFVALPGSGGSCGPAHRATVRRRTGRPVRQESSAAD